MYDSYVKSRFLGLHKSYSNKDSSSLLIFDRKREKCYLLGGHFDLLTAKTSELETPQSLFRLRLLKVEIW